MVGSPQHPSQEKRNQPRYSVSLRVDLKPLEEGQRQEILQGGGYYDLSLEDLSLTRPRQGLLTTQSKDLSGSGVRVLVPEMAPLDQGASVVLDVHLPGDRRVVKLLGDVIWKGEQGGREVAGVRIAALEEDGARRVKEFLAKLNT